MIKKIGIFVIMLLCSVMGFVACGDPYKKMTFSASSTVNLDETIELYLRQNADNTIIGDTIVINTTVAGVGKKVVKDIEIPTYNKYIEIEKISDNNGKASFSLTAKEEGSTSITVSTVEGGFSKTFNIEISLAVNSFARNNSVMAIREGGTLDLGANSKTYFDFKPINTSQINLTYDIEFEAGSSDYAFIENNVLHAVEGKTFPVDEEGRKFITVIAKSSDNPDGVVAQTFRVPVISISDNIEVEMNSSIETGGKIELTKNNKGQYEVILTPMLEGTLDGTGGVNAYASNRDLFITVGEDYSVHKKYKITVQTDDVSINASSYISLYDVTTDSDTSTRFHVIGKAKTTKPIVKTFLIDYVGDDSDNPDNDQYRFAGLFTQTIDIVFRVETLPKSNAIKVNGKYEENPSLIVYDYYQGSTGTYLCITETNSSLANMKYSITYESGGYASGLSLNTLNIFNSTQGNYVLDKPADSTLASNYSKIGNGDVLYLKHSYSALVPENNPKLIIKYEYTFAPSHEASESYYVYTAQKTINLVFLQGIRNIEVEDLKLNAALNDSSNLDSNYDTLYEFPMMFDARQSIQRVVSSDASLFQIKFENNFIYIKPNDNLEVGSFTLQLVATNGVTSNVANMLVYIPMFYEENEQIHITTDTTSASLFRLGHYVSAGDPTEEEKIFNSGTAGKSISLTESSSYSYSTFNWLTLSVNSSIPLNVFNIFKDINNNVSFINPNVNVTATSSNTRYLTWNKGILTTYNNITSNLDSKGVTLTFSMTGFDTNGEPLTEPFTHTVFIEIYKVVTSVKLEQSFKELYLRNTIGYEDYVEKSNFNIIPTVLPTNTLDEFGEVDLNYTLLNNKELGAGIRLSDLYEVKKIVMHNSDNKVTEKRILLTAIIDDGLLEGKGDIDNLFKQIIGDGVTAIFSVQFNQFSRTTTFEVHVVFKVAVQSQKPITNIDSNGIYYEYKDGVMSSAQTINYVINPYNALNKDIIVKMYASKTMSGRVVADDENEYNIKDESTNNYSVGAGEDCQASYLVNNGKIRLTITNEEFLGSYFLRIIPRDSLYSYSVQQKCIVLEDEQILYIKMDGDFYYLYENLIYQKTNDKVISHDILNYSGLVATNNADYDDETPTGLAEYGYEGIGDISGNTLKLIKDGVEVDKTIYSLEQEFFTDVEYRDVFTDVRVDIKDGSEEHKFQIRNNDAFITMLSDIKAEKNEYHYEQIYDLQMYNYIIGENRKDTTFKGSYNGNGKIIYGLSFQLYNANAEFNYGLFGTLEGKVENINLENVSMYIEFANTISRVNANIGFIAGTVAQNGLIINSRVSSSAYYINISPTNNLTSGSELYAGGFVGCNKGFIYGLPSDTNINLNNNKINSTIAMKVVGNDKFNNATIGFGGIAGINYCRVYDIATIPNIAAVTSGDDTILLKGVSIGGVAGILKTDENLITDENEIIVARIDNVNVSPLLNGYHNIGGVVGTAYFSKISDSKVVMAYTNNIKNYIIGFDKIGGLIGEIVANSISGDNEIEISSSYVRGLAVIDRNQTYNIETYMGNVVLRNDSELDVQRGGGLIGYATGAAGAVANISLNNCYFQGDLTSYVIDPAKEKIGGIIGVNADTVNNMTLNNNYVNGRIAAFVVEGEGDDAVIVEREGNMVTFTANKTTTTSTAGLPTISYKYEGTLTEELYSYFKITQTETSNVSYESVTNTYSNINFTNFYGLVNENMFAVHNSTSNNAVEYRKMRQSNTVERIVIISNNGVVGVNPITSANIYNLRVYFEERNTSITPTETSSNIRRLVDDGYGNRTYNIGLIYKYTIEGNQVKYNGNTVATINTDNIFNLDGKHFYKIADDYEYLEYRYFADGNYDEDEKCTNINLEEESGVYTFNTFELDELRNNRNALINAIGNEWFNCYNVETANEFEFCGYSVNKEYVDIDLLKTNVEGEYFLENGGWEDVNGYDVTDANNQLLGLFSAIEDSIAEYNDDSYTSLTTLATDVQTLPTTETDGDDIKLTSELIETIYSESSIEDLFANNGFAISNGEYNEDASTPIIDGEYYILHDTNNNNLFKAIADDEVEYLIEEGMANWIVRNDLNYNMPIIIEFLTEPESITEHGYRYTLSNTSDFSDEYDYVVGESIVTTITGEYTIHDGSVTLGTYENPVIIPYKYVTINGHILYVADGRLYTQYYEDIVEGNPIIKFRNYDEYKAYYESNGYIVIDYNKYLISSIFSRPVPRINISNTDLYAKREEANNTYDVYYNALFDVVSLINGNAIAFNEEFGVNKQGHIKVSDENLILLYNKIPSDLYLDAEYVMNRYSLSVDTSADSSQDENIIYLNFSNLTFENSIIYVNTIRDYTIQSSNIEILNIENQNNNVYITTCGCGTATLYFINNYNDSNSFAINVEVVNGFTDFALYDMNGINLGSASEESYSNLKTYVESSTSYEAKFTNKVDETYLTSYVGGYRVELNNLAGKFKINGVTVDDLSTNDTLYFTNNILNFVGIASGSVDLVITPYINYNFGGVANRYYLTSMSINQKLEIIDKAQSISTRNENIVDLKPNESCEIILDLITSDENEIINYSIKYNNQPIYDGTLEEGELKLNDQLLIINVSSPNVSNYSAEEGLYKVTYIIILSMNSDTYYELFKESGYKNPLDIPAQFDISFKPISNTNIIANYTYKITSNELYKIDMNFYAKSTATEDGIIVSPTEAETRIMAPGQTGILKLTTNREFNNVSYIELTSSLGSAIVYKQVCGNISNTGALVYEENTSLQSILLSNGIRLWNYTDQNSFENIYYVAITLSNDVKQNQNISILVRAYDANGNILPTIDYDGLDASIKLNLYVESLPTIKMVVDDKNYAKLPLGSKTPVQIIAEHIDGDINFDLTYSNGIKIYDIDGNEYTAGAPHTNDDKVYLAVLENDEYVKVDVIDPTKQHYIVVEPNAYMGITTINLSTTKYINGNPEQTVCLFNTYVMLATFEDMSIKGMSSDDELNITAGSYTGLALNLELNEHAMLAYNKYLKRYENDKNFEVNVGEDATEVAYAKQVIALYKQLAAQFAGRSNYVETMTLAGLKDLNIEVSNGLTDTVLNNWEAKYTDDNNYVTMVTGKSYPEKNKNDNTSLGNLRFDRYNTYYYIVGTLVSTTDLRITVGYNYDSNGIIQVVPTIISPETIKYCSFKLNILDNSTDDHPNPIENAADLMAMQPDAHYILLNDIELENWVPMPMNAGSLDGNAFKITIKSFDFGAYSKNTTVNAGLFSTISETSIVKNLTVDISPLLVTHKIITDNETHNASAKLAGILDVTFGVIAAVNEGVVTNTKVVNLNADQDNKYLYVATTQGYFEGDLCTAVVSPFVAVNSGAISNSYVGLSAVETSKGFVMLNDVSSDSIDKTQLYKFNFAGGNKIGGFVAINSGVISNSYVNASSIENLTNIENQSYTGGFVGKNSGKVYSCFISGVNLNGFRETTTVVQSKGTIGAFVHTNSGVIENAYAKMRVKVYSVESGGFVYLNEGGAIKNAYTTSITQTINSYAHGFFVSQKTNYGVLENCYYLLISGELGIEEDTHGSDAILKAIDPTNAIISEVDSSGSKENIRFRKTEVFEGFSFSANKTDDTSIWFMDEESGPQLYNCVTDTVSSRSLSSTKTTTTIYVDDNKLYENPEKTKELEENLYSVSGTAGNYVFTILDTQYEPTAENVIEVEGLNFGDSTVVHNYEWHKEYQIGSKNNPLIISNASEFTRNILANTKQYTIDDSNYYIFGLDTKAETSDVYNPRYVRIINNLDFIDESLSTQRAILQPNVYKSLSEIIFNGILLGNGMTLSNIRLTTSAIVEDYGLFKQIGIDDELAEKLSSEYLNNSEIVEPIVFNTNFEYREVNCKNAKKVGVLAGSVYNANLLLLNISGESEEVADIATMITGGNFVGGVAGLINGEKTKLVDITVNNVRINVSKNVTANLADDFSDKYGFYNAYAATIDSTPVAVSRINGESISDVANYSYGGGIAGVITTGSSIGIDKNNTYIDYRTTESNIHGLTVKGNFQISGDQVGGLFGYIGNNTHIKNSTFQLQNGNNSNENYQYIYGYNFAGGIAGEVVGGILEQVNVMHDVQTQINIDSRINEYNTTNSSIAISKTDLFTTDSANMVSVAIGGLLGYSENAVVIDSASKVNVENPQAKIAGGIVGYAKDYNYFAYTYTTGNVYAKEVIGGYVGFYLESSFDLYLYNAFAMNSWDRKIYTPIQNNNKAIYKESVLTSDDVRMPEIGNQLAQKSDGSYYEMSSKISDYIANGGLFTYIGSVIGKVTLADLGDNQYLSEDITVYGKNNDLTKQGRMVIGEHSAPNKDIFVYVSDDASDAYMTLGSDVNSPIMAINLATKNVNYVPINSNKILSRTASTSITGEGELPLTRNYYIYYNSHFFNVFSTTFGVLSTTGSLENGNLISSISPSSCKLIDNTAVEVLGDHFTGNNIKYDNIIGNQYYLSQITGYYEISDNSNVNYQDYVNEFNTVYGYTFNYTGTSSTSDEFLIDFIGSAGYVAEQDLVSQLSSKINGSKVWYINGVRYLPEYTQGKYNNFERINTENDLVRVFNGVTKNKYYELAPGDYTINLTGENAALYNDAFSGLLYGLVEDGNKPIITIKVSDSAAVNCTSLFQSIADATITNVDFEIQLPANKIVYANNGSAGFIASRISGSIFNNCNITITGEDGAVLSTLTMNNSVNEEENVEKFGLVFGSVNNLSMNSINMIFNIDVNVEDDNVLTQIGGFAAEVFNSNISDIKVVSNMGRSAQYSVNISNPLTSNYNIGVIIGYMQKTRMTNLNNALVSGEFPVELNVTGSVPTQNIKELSSNQWGELVDLGHAFGLIGRAMNSNLNSVNYWGNINIALSTFDGDTDKTTDHGLVHVGGVVGLIYNSTVANSQVNGINIKDDDDNITELHLLNGNTINVELTSGFNNSYINYNVGGIVGYGNNSSLTGGTQEKSILNNTNIVVKSKQFEAGKAIGNVGGIIGSFTNNKSGNNIEKVINLGEINVDDIDALTEGMKQIRFGGLVGYVVNGNISNSYNYGDIHANTITTEYRIVGGITGLQRNIIISDFKYTNVVSYGDIYYEHAIYQDYYAGIIGNTGGSKGTTLTSCKTYTNYIPEDTYTIEDFDYKICFEPFANGTKIDFADANNTFIKEIYLQQLTNKTKPAGASLRICDNYIKHAVSLAKYVVADNSILDISSIDDLIPLILFKTGIKVEGSKFNIKLITSLDSNMEGYYVINNSISGNTNSDIIVKRGTLIVGADENNGSLIENNDLTSCLFAENNGVIANVRVKNNSDTTSVYTSHFVDVNNGTIYNSALYGESKIQLGNDATFGGFTYTNNGDIFQCGISVEYTDISSAAANSIEFSPLVYENNGKLRDVYSTSNIFKNDNIGTNFKSAPFVYTNNVNGTLDGGVFGGQLYNTKLDEGNKTLPYYTNTVENALKNYYIDYDNIIGDKYRENEGIVASYAERNTLAGDESNEGIWKITAEEGCFYEYNYGYPYSTKFCIPTAVKFVNIVFNNDVASGDLIYYEPVGSQDTPYLIKTLSSTIAIQKMSQTKQKDIYQLADIDYKERLLGTIKLAVNGDSSDGYSYYGNEKELNDITINDGTSKALFNCVIAGKQISNLTLYNVKLTLNTEKEEQPDINNIALLVQVNNGIIKNIEINNSKLNIVGDKKIIISNVGIIAGTLGGRIENLASIEGTTMTITAYEANNIGFVAGKQTIADAFVNNIIIGDFMLYSDPLPPPFATPPPTNINTKMTINIVKGSNIGGLSGYAKDVNEIDTKINITGIIEINCKNAITTLSSDEDSTQTTINNVGGLFGYVNKIELKADLSIIDTQINVVHGIVSNIGGVVGLIESRNLLRSIDLKNIISRSDITSVRNNSTISNVGGIIGAVNGDYYNNITLSLVKFTGSIDASGYEDKNDELYFDGKLSWYDIMYRDMYIKNNDKYVIQKELLNCKAVLKTWEELNSLTQAYETKSVIVGEFIYNNIYYDDDNNAFGLPTGWVYVPRNLNANMRPDDLSPYATKFLLRILNNKRDYRKNYYLDYNEAFNNLVNGRTITYNRFYTTSTFGKKEPLYHNSNYRITDGIGDNLTVGLIVGYIQNFKYNSNAVEDRYVANKFKECDSTGKITNLRDYGYNFGIRCSWDKGWPTLETNSTRCAVRFNAFGGLNYEAFKIGGFFKDITQYTYNNDGSGMWKEEINIYRTGYCIDRYYEKTIDNGHTSEANWVAAKYKRYDIGYNTDTLYKPSYQTIFKASNYALDDNFKNKI